MLVAVAGLLTNSPNVSGQENGASSNAYLGTLTLSDIAIEHTSSFTPPGFSSLIFNYTPSVAHTLTETTVTPTPYHPGASYVIKVGGVTDADGVIALSVGSNVITIEVTAEDGQTTLTYTITVTRAPTPLTDATLVSLLLSGIDIGSGMGIGAIVPTDTSYAASVYNSVSQTAVTPTPNHSGAGYVIKLGGVTDADGAVELGVGSNVITVEVTSEDGQTTKTYTVTINRATASAPLTGELSTDDPPVNFRNTTITHDGAIYTFAFPRNRGIFGWVIQRYEHDGADFVSSGSDSRSEYTGARDLGGDGFKLGDSGVEPGVQYKWVLMLTDGLGSTVIETSVTVRAPGAPKIIPPIGPIVGIGGGGGPSGPTPSDVDFEWTVERDIEELDGSNEAPTGAWSNGVTLWITDNPNGAGDAVYAYDLASGERVEEQEFELDETNRAPRGAWSDRQTIWVPDSGQERLFAYDLESGERLEEREIELAKRNDDPRGIWSDGETMWVLDDRRNALFAYDIETGELLAEYALDDANDLPHGIWSDSHTVWVSNHDPKRLFAYRLPVPADDQGEEDLELERLADEEFTKLSSAGNNSPRGIWSDGEVMYVADANDGKVYTYNMPDAIDARLASLALSDIEIGEFGRDLSEYEGVPNDGVTQTTVAAEAAQDGASVDIDPSDADEDADGHQVDLEGVGEITVTVTAPDGSREKVYRVAFAETGPSASCLRGAVNPGFSLVAFEGGSVEDLVTCAQGRHVTALYALNAGEYVPYIVGAPDFATARFRGLFADGVPALLPLVVRSEGPATPAPAARLVAEPFETCLRGEIGEGFSLVVYEGGSVADLEACAGSVGVTAVYALVEGEYVPYILGAPEFATARFRALFPDGVPAATPLTVRGAGPSS